MGYLNVLRRNASGLDEIIWTLHGDAGNDNWNEAQVTIKSDEDYYVCLNFYILAQVLNKYYL